MSTERLTISARAAIVAAILLSLGVVYYLSTRDKPAIVNAAPEVEVAIENAHQIGANGEMIADAPATVRFPTGYVPNRPESEKFRATLPARNLFAQAPQLFQGDRQAVFLYRSLYKAYKEKTGQDWIVGTQAIGDCVSWGWKHGLDVHLALKWELGDASEWHEAASESIYGGSRCEARGQSFGGWGDGSYGAAAAKWLKSDGGAIFRQGYQSYNLDLSSYSGQRAKDWGAYGNGGKDDGLRGPFDREAQTHPVTEIALVTNFEEAAAAIASGYPVPVCSGQGFSSQRDRDGFCRASGSWSHCMCLIGVRYDRPGGLCLNSWGPKWVAGPKFPADQPDGSFWIDAATIDRMLAGNDSFAVSGYQGFPLRDLKNGDWVKAEPVQKPSPLVGPKFARNDARKSPTNWPADRGFSPAKQLKGRVAW